MLAVTPTDDAVCLALGAFVALIVPTGTPILRGPINKVAQPAGNHVLLTPISRRRLRTNVEVDLDQYPAPDPGAMALEQGVQLDVQADFYGTLSADWATMFQTAFRSEYAARALAPTCAPLYADDGRMVPLVTGEEQYLERWAVTAALQYNPVTTVPQEYAGAAEVTIINVDEAYPP